MKCAEASTPIVIWITPRMTSTTEEREETPQNIQEARARVCGENAKRAGLLSPPPTVNLCKYMIQAQRRSCRWDPSVADTTDTTRNVTAAMLTHEVSIKSAQLENLDVTVVVRVAQSRV